MDARSTRARPAAASTRGFRIRNSGYAERDNGTAISKRALKAEENGTFTAGTFRKNYGVSKKAFDILLTFM